MILKQTRIIFFDDNVLTTSDLDQFPEIRKRIPHVYKNFDPKNWIDLNLIENINEIIGSPRVTIIDTPEFTFSFDTITQESGGSVLKKLFPN